MMMPANYSVIAENELTYVNGGALIDCFAPIMNAGNWKTFNTNLIKVIGNTSMKSFLNATVGQLFSGKFSFDSWGTTLQNTYWGSDSVINNLLSIVGGLAAVYTLGTADADVVQAEKVLTVTGEVWA